MIPAANGPAGGSFDVIIACIRFGWDTMCLFREIVGEIDCEPGAQTGLNHVQQRALPCPTTNGAHFLLQPNRREGTTQLCIVLRWIVNDLPEGIRSTTIVRKKHTTKLVHTLVVLETTRGEVKVARVRTLHPTRYAHLFLTISNDAQEEKLHLLF